MILGMTSYAVLLDRIVTLQSELDRPPVVGISGHGGAGKTTLARRLAADVGVSWDQVLRSDRLKSRQAGPDAGLWELQDWPTVFEVLRQVRAGEERLVYIARTYDGDETPVDVVMPSVAILEGIRVLRPETRPLLDLAVWIDMPAETAGERAVARNVEQGDSQEELDLWATKWIPEGRAYEREVRPQELADLVLPASS